MSKRLVFTLKPIVSALGSALEVHMHRGGSLHVEPFREATYKLPVDEEMTDEELLKWYDRYASLGLETKVVDLPDTVPVKQDMPEVLVNPIPPSIPVSGISQETPDVIATEVIKESSNPAEDMYFEPEAEEVLISAGTEIISEVMQDVEDDEVEQEIETLDFNSMSTSQLRDYCKSHGIQVSDMRSRSQLLKAVKGE